MEHALQDFNPWKVIRHSEVTAADLKTLKVYMNLRKCHKGLLHTLKGTLFTDDAVSASNDSSMAQCEVFLSVCRLGATSIDTYHKV